MERKKTTNDFPFYQALLDFYKDKKGLIKRYYKDASKRFLNYNDKEINPNAFLRTPQFEALEIYIMIKEYLNNAKVKQIFDKWYKKEEKFEKRDSYLKFGQMNLFDEITNDTYSMIFDQMDKNDQIYPNYIYALTMGTGKTILMATCIFYEFILANSFPKDERFIHNALIFAPDKTVLHSLKEIQTFDLRKVVPPEYVNFLSSNLKFHYLDDSSKSLNTMDGSNFNVIISNTQKIILKKVHKEKSAIEKLLEPSDSGFDSEFLQALYEGIDCLGDEQEVSINQKFQKIIRLNQLGVYVDEAHHLFGSDLKKALSDSSKETSLRFTINQIAKQLEEAGTKLVACYNYTGTPYVENRILPEVVYSYSLKDAINNGYLKQVEIQSYENVKSVEFLKDVITNFFETYKDNTYEGLKPKLAIFGSQIEEVIDEIKPNVENILSELGIDLNTILVNVGDTKYTKEDDIRNFNNLDVAGTEGSNKQIILLVNKGREGWNCRSLFGTALFRSPKSNVFVLQSTMRCLRSITEKQQIAHVYLSKDNYEILDSELKKNFNLTIKEIQDKKDLKEDYEVFINESISKKIKIADIKKKYSLVKKENANKFSIDFDKIDFERYKTKKKIIQGIDGKGLERNQDLTASVNRHYSYYEIICEIARYLHESPLEIEDIIDEFQEQEKIVEVVSNYNDIMYDELIPSIFNYLYKVNEETESVTREVELIHYPKGVDHFNFKCNPKLTVQMNDTFVAKYNKKSFHADRYCFDSNSERTLFTQLLESDNVKEVYFTGMFTGSENGLCVQYIDPDSKNIRNYYPDILVIYQDGTMEVIEVKGDNRINSIEVEAKAFAMRTFAEECGMTYSIVKSSEIDSGKYIVKKTAK